MSALSSVTVIGGGAVGLATAYYLRKADLDVTVIESGRPGRAASWGNGGWLSPVLSIPTPGPGMPRMGVVESFQRDSAVAVRPHASPSMIPWLLRFARHCTRSAFESGSARLGALSREMFDGFDELADLGVPVEVPRRGNLRACLTEAEARRQLAGLAPMRSAGYTVPDRVMSAGEIHELEPELSDNVRSGFNLPDERHVDPGAFCDTLADHLVKQGVHLLADTRATGVRASGGRVTAVETTAGQVRSDALVVAAGLDTRLIAGWLGARLPIRGGKGYSFFVPSERSPSHPLYLSNTKVGVTPLKGGYRVLGGMELADETLRINPRMVRGMVRVADRYLRRIPAYESMTELRDLWAGLRPMTPDGLPVIDHLPHLSNAYVNTGHGMLGVGLSMVSGSALADYMVNGRRPDVLAPFGATRF
ncbi:FAD-dependent oxidoreductase [Nonomuraea terrae]|uniref:FAD-dependent oxidoreductase n=1 Tax=Nonomuraea terrae TaxID=2530383 RepID=A0A4R4Z8V4_9ACTN|nr:FAD-dependent oxidoreductase [Nonomuraea terrae]TDD53529.1 FAD-dependent oxidoreductase [Nonomuraea terrae]